MALAAADWDSFAARKADSARRGKIRGRRHRPLPRSNAPASNEDGRHPLRGFITGTLDYGQGHASAFAQVLQDKLGVPFERIRLLQGDSDEMLAGGGTGGSRSIMQSGSAILEAGDLVIEKGQQIAAHLLEVDEEDVAFENGRFGVAGTDVGIDILDLAERLRIEAADLPESLPRTLDVSHVFGGVPSAFPNGCHVAEVELDPETGVIEVVSYKTVNDFGNLVNPMLVAGQAHGGIAQGIGQALTESVTYDEDGQLMTGSYMDYALPRADHAPSFGFISHPVPARTNPLGVKGCGEAGCAGSLPAVMNAVVDALSAFGITHIDMPATPVRVWQAIQAARMAA